MPTNHLLTPSHNWQEVPLISADFPQLTDGSYLKRKSGKYCAGRAIVIPFEIVKAAPLLWATSAQQACTSATGKTTNIYTESLSAIGVAHDCEMLWKQRGFLTSNEEEILSGS